MKGFMKITNRHPSIIKLASLCALIFILIIASSCGDTPKGPVSGIRLPDIEGRMTSLSDYKGRVVLLNFWATWCPPCQDEIPDFIKLQEELGPKGLTIVGISVDSDDVSEVRNYSRQLRINYPILYAGEKVEESVEAVGGFRGIPTSFVIDREGKIVKKISGIVPKAMWEKVLSNFL